MTDEEFVQAHWEWVQVRLAEPFEGIAKGKWTARLPMLPFSQHGFDTEAEAWAAAAEFTRERLEQIRQLKRDIAFMRQFESSAEEWLEHLDRQRDADENAADARSACPMVRIIARLEFALADLKRGMTPTP